MMRSIYGEGSSHRTGIRPFHGKGAHPQEKHLSLGMNPVVDRDLFTIGILTVSRNLFIKSDSSPGTWIYFCGEPPIHYQGSFHGKELIISQDFSLREISLHERDFPWGIPFIGS